MRKVRLWVNGLGRQFVIPADRVFLVLTALGKA
jgi:hypothetical protein